MWKAIKDIYKKCRLLCPIVDVVDAQRKVKDPVNRKGCQWPAAQVCSKQIRSRNYNQKYSAGSVDGKKEPKTVKSAIVSVWTRRVARIAAGHQLSLHWKTVMHLLTSVWLILKVLWKACRPDALFFRSNDSKVSFKSMPATETKLIWTLKALVYRQATTTENASFSTYLSKTAEEK